MKTAEKIFVVGLVLAIVCLLSGAQTVSASPANAYENAFIAYQYAENAYAIGGLGNSGFSHYIHVFIKNTSSSSKTYGIENIVTGGGTNWKTSVSDNNFTLAVGENKDIKIKVQSPNWSSTFESGHLDLSIRITDSAGATGTLTDNVTALNLRGGGTYNYISFPTTSGTTTLVNAFPNLVYWSDYYSYYYSNEYIMPDETSPVVAGLLYLILMNADNQTLVEIDPKIDNITVLNYTATEAFYYENAFTITQQVENRAMYTEDGTTGAHHYATVNVKNTSTESRVYAINFIKKGGDNAKDWTIAFADNNFTLASGADENVRMTITAPKWDVPNDATKKFWDSLYLEINVTDNRNCKAILTDNIISLDLSAWTYIGFTGVENGTFEKIVPSLTYYTDFVLYWNDPWGTDALCGETDATTQGLGFKLNINKTKYTLIDIDTKVISANAYFGQSSVKPTRPVLVSPENNTSTTDNTPTFTWTGGANADNHRIEVDNDSDFSSPIDNENVALSDNSWTKTGAGYAVGTYYWRVWAQNVAGENCSENTWKFTITPLFALGKPVLLTPENNYSTADNTPTFTWTRGSGADNHRIEVDNDDNWANGLVDNVVIVPSYVPSDNLIYSYDDEIVIPYGGYSEGDEGEVESWTSTVAGTLRISFALDVHNMDWVYGRIYRNGSPVGQGHWDSGTYTENISGWSVGDNIELWAFQGEGVSAATVLNFRIYGSSAAGDDNTWTKSAPGYALGTYYWRVWAQNAGGENVSENVWKFTVTSAAPPVTPTLPRIIMGMETASATNGGSPAVATLKVFGTLYTKAENGQIWCQLLDNTGTPVNTATVKLNCYYENLDKYLDNVTMTYVTGSIGVYTYDFLAPSTYGVYLCTVWANWSGNNAYGSAEFQVSSTWENINNTYYYLQNTILPAILQARDNAVLARDNAYATYNYLVNTILPSVLQARDNAVLSRDNAYDTYVYLTGTVKPQLDQIQENVNYTKSQADNIKTVADNIQTGTNIAISDIEATYNNTVTIINNTQNILDNCFYIENYLENTIYNYLTTTIYSTLVQARDNSYNTYVYVSENLKAELDNIKDNYASLILDNVVATYTYLVNTVGGKLDNATDNLTYIKSQTDNIKIVVDNVQDYQDPLLDNILEIYDNVATMIDNLENIIDNCNTIYNYLVGAIMDNLNIIENKASRISAMTVPSTWVKDSDNCTIYARVLDENGNPATLATVKLCIWRSDNTLFLENVTMTSLARGIYQYMMTSPGTVGSYGLDIYSTNPTAFGSGVLQVVDPPTGPQGERGPTGSAGKPGADFMPSVVFWLPIIGYFGLLIAGDRWVVGKGKGSSSDFYLVAAVGFGLIGLMMKSWGLLANSNGVFWLTASGFIAFVVGGSGFVARRSPRRLGDFFLIAVVALILIVFGLRSIGVFVI